MTPFSIGGLGIHKNFRPSASCSSANIALRTLGFAYSVGWHEPESHFLGYGFDDRGRRTDEALRLMRALWAGQSEFEGEYWSLRMWPLAPSPTLHRRSGSPEARPAVCTGLASWATRGIGIVK